MRFDWAAQRVRCALCDPLPKLPCVACAGQYAAACADLDLVAAREPQHVAAHFQRGVALANLEQLDAAIAALSCAIKLEPGHVRALYARASCRNRRADFARANGAGVWVQVQAAKFAEWHH